MSVSSLNHCAVIGNSTNCISVLKSINKKLVELEASLDILQEHVEKEKALVEQGEVFMKLKLFHSLVSLILFLFLVMTE